LNVKISKQTQKTVKDEVVKAVTMKNIAFLVGCDVVCQTITGSHPEKNKLQLPSSVPFVPDAIIHNDIKLLHTYRDVKFLCGHTE
jgi:hypothetical protein